MYRAATCSGALREALALVLTRDPHSLAVADVLRSTPLRGRVRRLGCLRLRWPCLNFGFVAARLVMRLRRSHVTTAWTILPSLLVDMKHGPSDAIGMRCANDPFKFPHPQSLISPPASGSLLILEDIDNVVAAHERDGRVRETSSSLWSFLITPFDFAPNRPKERITTYRSSWQYHAHREIGCFHPRHGSVLASPLHFGKP